MDNPEHLLFDACAQMRLLANSEQFLKALSILELRAEAVRLAQHLHDHQSVIQDERVTINHLLKPMLSN
jgi:hypothetical protein